MAEAPSTTRAVDVPRAVLLAIAAGFVANGVAFLFAPGKLAGLVDLTAGSKAALVELRAFYGGIELGLGAFFAIAALKKEWQVPSLAAALLALAGVAGARIYGISVEGSAGALIYLLLAIEVAGAVLAAVGLVQAKRPPPEKSETGSDSDSDQPELIEKTVPIERTKAIEHTVRMDRKKAE